MEIKSFDIEGPKFIRLKVHGDSRGFFIERFNLSEFRRHGLPSEYVQDNHSRSQPGVLRGLHLQLNPPQGKLVGLTRGRIFDVAVDVRPNSSTRGKYVSAELSAEEGTLLWIPGGFAHGFCVLGNEPADVLYKVDQFYKPEGELALMWNDPNVNIKWPISQPQLSTKDQQALAWEGLCSKIDNL
jgi:dTDP-4-dehydrorhamnose 3,5-epimerase